MKSERNYLIDVFRYIASVLIISLHTDFLLDVNVYVGYFMSNVIPRLAVPFFACVSGYYFFKTVEKVRLNLEKSVVKLLT